MNYENFNMNNKLSPRHRVCNFLHFLGCYNLSHEHCLLEERFTKSCNCAQCALVCYWRLRPNRAYGQRAQVISN
jgi:hypothetical protein